MASSSGNTEIALQIFFGIFSIIGIIVTLAGIHYRDSLAGVLLGDRRNRSPSTCTSQRCPIQATSNVAPR